MEQSEPEEERMNVKKNKQTVVMDRDNLTMNHKKHP